MLHKGEWVVVRDSDLEDSYIAQVMADHDERQQRSPLVKIAYPLTYPRQTAVIYPDVPNENVPLPDGAILRMPFFLHHKAPPGEYADGLKKALEYAILQARAACRNDVLSILQRHKKGEYGRQRRI